LAALLLLCCSDEADDVLKCIGLALCVQKALRLVLGSNLPLPEARITARLQEVGPLTPLRDIKSTVVGKLLAVRGNVIRVSAVRPLVQRLDFVCAKCYARFEVRGRGRPGLGRRGVPVRGRRAALRYPGHAASAAFRRACAAPTRKPPARCPLRTRSPRR
jgi:hypothetical protein